ncbi:MAG: dinitrogenase iron-molybdenum cofactor biosynthesis protein [Chloroflexi bacterium]|nr:MAG: dinitrogenase iron-molybdenum cofactor biosynthesis protein [Chloroflexota bacterium]
MKILLTTVSPNLESELDPRFGRGAYYLMIDPDTLEWNAVANPAIQAPGGAGIQSAQFVVNQQCDAVVSGDFGPNAYNALKAAGILMYRFGISRTVSEVIDRFKAGQLETLDVPGNAGHSGRGRMR